MRTIVEPRLAKECDPEATRSLCQVRVNTSESALSWLFCRNFITVKQYEAGERLREDYETASLSPSVTMRWDAVARGSRTTESPDPTIAQISAKNRFHDAIEAAGPGLSDILWRTVCANEGLPSAEKALGWPTRSGKLVLTLALDRLAMHYRLP